MRYVEENVFETEVIVGGSRVKAAPLLDTMANTTMMKQTA